MKIIKNQKKKAKTELSKLEKVLKCFRDASTETKSYEKVHRSNFVHETIPLCNVVKVEGNIIKMTDRIFLLELPNDYGLKDQFINVNSFLKNGEMDYQYEYNYPDFDSVKRVYENSCKIDFEIKEFLKNVSIRHRTANNKLDLVLRIIKNNLYIYIRDRRWGYSKNQWVYEKLGVIKVNNPSNINSRLMFDPAKFVNILKIFKEYGSQKVELEFNHFNIKNIRVYGRDYYSWANEPITIRTENCFGMIMQRIDRN
jgi:hypothetical protein